MTYTPPTQELVRKATESWGWTQKFKDPASASGQCYLTTKRVLDYYDNPEGLQVAFARHHNNPDGRWMELGQYSNHYAIWHPEERLVVDFTMRQFAPTSAWPWVGTYSAWLRILARAWGVSSVKHLTRTRGPMCYCSTVNCHNCEDSPSY